MSEALTLAKQAERAKDRETWVEEMNKKQPDFEAAFNMIANPDDWKAPIKTRIKKKDYERCREACIHFTATNLEIYGEGCDDYEVRSIGYRAGPAGP